MDGRELQELKDGVPSLDQDNLDIESSKEAFDNLNNEIINDSKHIATLNDPESFSPESEDHIKLRDYFMDSQRMAKENGSKEKKIGVTFKSLTVVGKGADASVISDMSSPLFSFIDLFKPSTWTTKVSEFDILHDVTGFCKDGEMLLVLGRPGSGCSTLLRVLSNQTKSYVSVKGDVTYGGIDSNNFKYKAEAIYTPEEDCHHPTLTVRETLDFALKCKTPTNRLPNENKRSFRDKVFNLLLTMFGMVHQSETIVGNEFIRGLSGGERKRLTITEAMVSGSSVTCWDCSTRGLDAASALNLAKSLRITTDTLHKTTIASFYQASDSIYNCFDKVLILEKGRCIYFGPVSNAKQYFLDLGFDCEPRKSIPDFLTGVTNPQERIVKQGYEDKVPITSGDFEEVWKNSKLYQISMEELKDYEIETEKNQPSKDFIEEIKNQKSKTNRKGSQYTTSFITQVIALVKRNFSMIWGDKFGIFSKYLSVIIQACVYGSLFYGMKDDMAGVFTRGGAITGGLFFNAFLSVGEMQMTFFGRRILQKHSSYKMYRPAALHIAQVVNDLPFTLAQVILFSSIVYFMFGLTPDADKFFIYIFINIGCALCCTALFRLFGNLCPSMYVAQNILNVFMIFLFTFAGYTIPKDKLDEIPWFGWFFWCNPFAYSFKALMENEFVGLEFQCTEEAIPYGDFYQNYTANRICPVAGSNQGELKFSGSFYLTKNLSFPTNQLALNTIVVYLLWVLFIILNMIAMSYLDHTSGGYTHKVYKKGKAPKMNDIDEERNQIELVAKATSNIKDTLEMHGGIFTWKNINYTVPVPGGEKLLLDNIDGWIKPGQMTALMGASGAGKTTLLDVLAKRKTLGTVKGECTLNGKPLEIDFERITGYVEQMDVHNPGLTVREALRFSAKLRQEPEVSLEEKFKYVEHVLEMMEMAHLGDALVGNLETGVGISVEERKRLTIGLELVAKPYLLFLDEPTSGLDAQSSYNIIKFIRKLADAGMPLVCTIHQPSSVLFEHFDRILLLGKGGKTVYFGDIGERSSVLSGYFERYGVRPCTQSENPAEYMFEALSTDVNWPVVWNESPEKEAVTLELDQLKVTVNEAFLSQGKPREFATSLWYQFKEVYKRLNLIWWRDPYYTFGCMGQAIISGLVLGFTFFNLQDSSSDMIQRVFFIFEAIILGILLIFAVMPQIIIQKAYFTRDFASKYYSWLPFTLGIVIVELPYTIISGTLFYFCSFWTAGLNYDAYTNFYFWIIYILFMIFCVTFGQAISAFCINNLLAMTVLPLLAVYLFLFSGVMVPPSKIHGFEKWMYYVNPTKYFLEGISTNILDTVNVICTERDLVLFTYPKSDFSSCKEYTEQFELNIKSGYVDNNENGTLPEGYCGYCNYNSGKEYYDTLEWSNDNRWWNFLILCGYVLFNIAMTVGFIYLTKKGRR
ncbi:hypothetical protein DICPUDRAFT_154132 [Dictyostelium purpureum]|uniref:ABC transporter domain-containing protein n=1 Tax=Dictyostelium purpureum TaxID=5786 RepID=F0ZQM9_DICPU|nr:uncharacterized protein DICPUDRAFT_154132 [Dictyostelium purpureum]EGC33758.1 hypothetical protein DICPUDRAFT_154132 [Dictyostelium purpureum]|eukprot:XP_003289724.1 hypothetical protein DICPUDRAFT_154132 [Dictyostelium purpureum]